MRHEKKVKIDGKTIIVRELTVAEIQEYYQNDAGIEILAGFAYGDHEYVPLVLEKCTGMSGDEIRNLGATDYGILIEALREVHADFFEILRRDLEKSGRKVEIEHPSPSPSAG